MIVLCTANFPQVWVEYKELQLFPSTRVRYCSALSTSPPFHSKYGTSAFPSTVPGIYIENSCRNKIWVEH